MNTMTDTYVAEADVFEVISLDEAEQAGGGAAAAIFFGLVSAVSGVVNLVRQGRENCSRIARRRGKCTN